jgi:hypothetical protein
MFRSVFGHRGSICRGLRHIKETCRIFSIFATHLANVSLPATLPALPFHQRFC